MAAKENEAVKKDDKTQNNGPTFGFPNTFPSPVDSNHPWVHLEGPREYKNAREYAQALNGWLWQYRMLQAFSSFQSQMMMSMHQHPNFQPHITPAPNVNPGSTEPTGQQAAADHTSPVSLPDGVQYRIPMLWRRVVAEFLDFVLLFYLKILVTVGVLRQMGYMTEDPFDLDAQIPFISDFNELDYEQMFSLTSELIALEVINRLCITIVETMCIKQGYATSIGGATPGKKIMQLRVISFDEIRETRDRYVVVTGARNPGLINALVRSVIKNFSMAFFFPASLTVFFFRFNRAAYDVLAQSIVVEVDPRPRRP